MYSTIDFINDNILLFKYIIKENKEKKKLFIYLIILKIFLIWVKYCIFKAVLYAILNKNKYKEEKKDFWYVILHSIPLEISKQIRNFFINLFKTNFKTGGLLLNRFYGSFILGAPIKVLITNYELTELVIFLSKIKTEENKFKIFKKGIVFKYTHTYMKVVYTNKSLNRVQYIKNIKFMYLTKLIKIECELEKLDYAIELLKIKNKDFNLKNISKIENKGNLELENYEIEKYARGIFLDEDENIGDIRTLGNYETYGNDIEKYYKFFNDNIKLKILIDEKVEKIKKYELLGVEIKKEEERIELKFEKKNMITALEIGSCIEPLPSENTSLFIIENKHAEISKLDKRDAFNLAEKENFEKAKIIIIFKNIFDGKEINTTLIFKVSNNKSEIEELEEILKKK